MSNDHVAHIAAIVWRGTKPVKITVNSSKQRKSFGRYYSPKSEINGPQTAFCTHAEMEALRFAKSSDKLEVIRWRADGSVAIAKPCPHCQAQIKRHGIKNVWYTDESGTMVKL